MNSIKLFLNQYIVYAIYGFLILTCVNTCNSCSSTKEDVRMRKEIDSLSVQVKAVEYNSYNKEELTTRISIEGYEISKRMLYDNNAIVRTTVRPDDRMNEYDQKIKELNTKLK